MAQNDGSMNDSSEPVKAQRMKSTIYRVSDIINADNNSSINESGVWQSSSLPNETINWQSISYDSEAGIDFKGRFYPYSEYPETAWNQLATYNEIIYPYVSSICFRIGLAFQFNIRNTSLKSF